MTQSKAPVVDAEGTDDAEGHDAGQQDILRHLQHPDKDAHAEVLKEQH